jgi:hypothetical protein
LVRAFPASDARFLADATHPLVRTGRCVARATRLGIGPELRIDVVAAAEQGAEEGDLLGRRFRRGAPRSDAVGPTVRTQIVQRRELALEATEFVVRHLPLAVEGAQLGSPFRDLGP